ncbi:MAG: cytochrome c biogenesis protein ResB [Actinomycetota bacterium]|nr:cytochrome c biogenesis protein ResB [Actinomycetota bacterium]
MRTALILLFLLAVAAVPGSLLPQRPLNPSKVDAYRATHGRWGAVLDRFGLFDVFGAPWFAAIYLLLAISLTGCLVPRIRLHLNGVRARPLPAPRNLSRLPQSVSFAAAGEPDAVAADLRARLGRRWRTQTRPEPGRVMTVSAEKGYLRETGNLIFHVALLASLVAIAAGRLWGYSASVVVTEGSGFCNTVQQYDSWRPGRFTQDGRVAPFCIDELTRFTASYLPSGEPSKFAADVVYSRGVDGAPERHTITVNHPLRLEGDRVYLIGHGFSPTITVTMPDGRVRTETAPLVPQDPTTYQSEGAYSLQAKGQPDGRHRDDIGISAFFSPSPVVNANGVITSAAPQPKNPVLGVIVYRGDLGYTGLPRSVYSLPQAQIDNGQLAKIGRKNLTVGQTLTMAGGVRVRFDGWKQWASLQVSHDPTQGYLLVSASAMVVGLIGSLGVRRRRVWIRVRPGGDPPSGAPGPGRSVVEVGGLARSDAGSFATEFAGLSDRLRPADLAPTAGDPAPTAGKE